MESMGIDWVPRFDLLEVAGLEVVLVNATHLHNVPGRKGDVLDCQRIQKLHSYGLLRASFRPTLISGDTREALHMQKALQIMNVQIHHAVSDSRGHWNEDSVQKGDCQCEIGDRAISADVVSDDERAKQPLRLRHCASAYESPPRSKRCRA